MDGNPLESAEYRADQLRVRDDVQSTLGIRREWTPASRQELPDEMVAATPTRFFSRHSTSLHRELVPDVGYIGNGEYGVSGDGGW